MMLDELKKRTTSSPVSGKLYLALFHGRSDPDQDMEDWGEAGPLLGPLDWCHITYCTSINLGFSDGLETGPTLYRDGLGFYEDMLYFDGVYYGDWELQLAK